MRSKLTGPHSLSLLHRGGAQLTHYLYSAASSLASIQIFKVLIIRFAFRAKQLDQYSTNSIRLSTLQKIFLSFLRSSLHIDVFGSSGEYLTLSSFPLSSPSENLFPGFLPVSSALLSVRFKRQRGVSYPRRFRLSTLLQNSFEFLSEVAFAFRSGRDEGYLTFTRLLCQLPLKSIFSGRLGAFLPLSGGNEGHPTPGRNACQPLLRKY